MRRIVHVDMDAFYAAVEQRDRPELRGRPLVIGGSPHSRGVVCTASYEARRFGVRSAIPCSQAARLCPDAVFLPPDFKRYQAVSRQIRAIFEAVTPLVEPLSLDEAYLDVTTNHLGLPTGTEVARWVRARIRDETGLTASGGVGPNKLVAKIASDQDKPDGLTVVPPSRVQAFLRPLPLRRIWGVGPATEQRLHALGLQTAGDVADLPDGGLDEALGSYGPLLQRLCRGQDDRPVSPHRDPKTRGAETTFPTDVTDLGTLLDHVGRQATRVAEGLQRIERLARGVVLKVRYDDFQTVTRSRTLPTPTADPAVLRAAGAELLQQTEAGSRPVRLVGVSASVAGPGPAQLPLPYGR